MAKGISTFYFWICSTCGKYIMQQYRGPLFSHIYAHTWTDLKMTKGTRQLDVTMSLLLVKCPHCSALLWIREQEKVGEIKPLGSDGVLSATDKNINKPYRPTLR